jgi:hypothetical protein
MQIRAAQALKEQVGSGRTINLAAAAREAGYSEQYAHSGKLQRSPIFRQLMQDIMPVERVATMQRELLCAYKPKTYEFSAKLSDAHIRKILKACDFLVIRIVKINEKKCASVAVPDNQARKTALDLWHKIMGTLTTDKTSQTKTKKMGEILREIREKQSTNKINS